MKTVLQALSDEVHYPLKQGFLENKLLVRGITPETESTPAVLKSAEFRGALADSLFSLIQAPNITEAGISISLQDRDRILTWANSIYRELGEPEQTASAAPKVKFL